MMKKRQRYMETLVLAMVASQWPVNVGAQSPVVSAPNPQASDVTPARLGAIPLDFSATYEGFTVALDDVLLGSDEMGRIVDLPVRLGQVVSKGQVLARLDDAVQQAAVRVAEVQAESTGEIEAAVAAVKLQKLRTDQLEQLQTRSMAGPDETRRAIAELEMAEARLLSAREQQQLRVAELERLQLQLSRREIHAPFDGIVAEKIMSVGSTISPTNPTVLRLIRIDALESVFNLPAGQALSLQVESSVQVYLRAARRTVDAKVDSIAPAIDGESGTIQVRVRIENSDQSLRPGDRCTMRIIADAQTDAAPKMSHRPSSAPATNVRWGDFKRSEP